MPVSTPSPNLIRSRRAPDGFGIAIVRWIVWALISLRIGSIALAGTPPTTAIAWGTAVSGPIRPPASTEGRTVAIAANDGHSLALLDDGSVVGWGNNSQGQSDVPAEATHDIVAIAAGYSHSLALTRAGRVIAWGANSAGQCKVPIAAQSGVTQIAAGQSHSLALRRDGSVIAWGNNANGQTDTPINADRDIVSIGAGTYHSLAVNRSGAVIAWGETRSGQCAVPIVASSGVVKVSGGRYHSLALKGDGSLIAWGNGDFGAAAVPTNLNRGVVSIACGPMYNLALRDDGTVLSWSVGSNDAASSPPNLPNQFRDIAAGADFSLGLRASLAPAFVVVPESRIEQAGKTLSLMTSLYDKVDSFQWQLNGTNLPGATNNWLTFDPLQVSDSGSYTLIASNAWGMSTSAPPTVLSVFRQKVPVIVNQPQGFEATEGQATIPLSVTALGGTLQYQWQKDGENLPGAVQQILNLGTATPALEGRYSVIVSNALGSVTSSPPAVVHVIPINHGPLTIVRGPQSAVVPEFSFVPLLVTAAGSPVEYQWFKNGTAIPGATNSSLVLRAIQGTDAGFYHVRVSSGTRSITSDPPARISVLPTTAPVIVTSPVGGSVSPGQWLTLSMTATGFPLHRQWYKNGKAIEGATNTTLLVLGSNSNSTGDYTVTVANAAGSVTSSPPARVVYSARPAIRSKVEFGGTKTHPPDSFTLTREVVQIKKGSQHYLALYADGSVGAWMDPALEFTRNQRGELVPQLLNYGQSMVPAAAGSDVVEIEATAFGSLARKSDGTIVAWGFGIPFGQARVSPPSSVRSIAGGEGLFMINADGGVVMWDPSRNSFDQFIVPPAALSDVVTVAGIFALKQNGTVVALGSEPVPEEARTGMVAIALQRWSNSDSGFMVGARADGTILAWNRFGTVTQFAVQVPNVVAFKGGTTGNELIGEGGMRVLALTTDGNLLSLDPQSSTSLNDFNPGPWRNRVLEFVGNLSDYAVLLRADPQPQSIRIEPTAGIPWNSAPFRLTATASSGLPVRYTLLDGPAVFENGLVRPTGLGEVRIAVDQDGTADYQPATRQLLTLSLVPALKIVSPVPGSGRSPSLVAWLPAEQSAVLEQRNWLTPWTPVKTITGLGAETPIEIEVSPPDAAPASGFWRLTLDLNRH